MPLRETETSYECPIGRIIWDKLNNPYLTESRKGPRAISDGSPFSECLAFCLLSRHGEDNGENSGWNWEEVCQCPSDLTFEEYEKLVKSYRDASNTSHSTGGLLEFIEKNRSV